MKKIYVRFKKPASRSDAEFNEADHPRAEDGKFGSGGGSGGDKIKDAAKVFAAMPKSKIENFTWDDIHANGGRAAYLLYEAAKLSPRPVDKLKRVTNANSWGLNDEFDYVANVDGEHIGICKYDDPDANEDEDGEEFVYAFTPLAKENTLELIQTTTANKEELFKEIRKHLAGESRKDAEFREEDHPRAKDGKFGSGGSSASPEENRKPEEGGYIDEHGNERAPGLNENERKIETVFYSMIRNNKAQLIAAYKERNGNVIDPDLVKILNDDFAQDTGLAKAVHEPSSAFAKAIYANALKNKALAGDKSPVILTAGGSGSGKSATQGKAMEAIGAKEDAIVYDSTLSSFNSATARIKTALDAQGGPVGIVYTNANIEIALKFNAARQRSVSIDTLINAHVGASDTIKKLAEHYKDNPRVQIVVMNNLGKREDVSQGQTSDVPKYEKEQLRAKLELVAKGLLDSGKITNEKYQLLIRKNN